MYLGFLSAAVPEGINKASDYIMSNPPSVWPAMTDYGLDKVSHLGFSYFGARALIKGSETVPEYMKRMEESDAPFSDHVYAAGVKLSEPSMQQKTALAFGAVAVLGTGKELTDSYIDYLDMTANMTGGSLAVLEEYGEGSVRRGVRKTFDDISRMLEEDAPNTEQPLYANGGSEIYRHELEYEVMENLEALGKA